jgi:hypothetical protein
VARQLLSGLGMTGRLNLRSWWKEQEFLPPVDRLGALFEWLLQAVDGKIAVLDWTGGQPFLTQRVCRLVGEMPQPSNSGGNQTEDVGEMVGAIVRSNIIEHWESNDEQTHLRTIRDRVLECGGQQRRDRLGIYQEILQRGWVGADDSAEQMALRLSGLVVKRDGQLQGYNRIYQAVFDDRWVREELGKLRPFAAQLVAWLGDREPGRLLRGQPIDLFRNK